MRPVLAISALLFVLLVLVAACGGGDDEGGETPAATETADQTTEEETGEETTGDAEAGADVFASAGCGDCHTLEAAGSSGTSAPNLDEVQPDFETVVEQVRNGGGGMPAFGDRLSEQEIRNVAAFVSENAGG